MRVLAVDTALGACSAAVIDDQVQRAHRYETMERGHAERLAPMVRETLDDAGVTLSSIDRLAVTTGPGTFVGQRVGIAFMRGLRLALGRPLIGITTLDAMLAAISDETGLEAAAVLHDARRAEVYCAASLRGKSVVPVSLLPAEEAVSIIGSAFSWAELAVGGTAAGWFDDAYRRHGGIVRSSKVRAPDALWVARLALDAAEPRDPPRPLYLRDADARLPGAS